MKISLIATKGGWHTEELRRATKKKKLQFEVLKITSLNDCKKEIEKMGDIVIWFSSQLKKIDRKVTFFNLMKNKVVMNSDCLRFPFLTRKLFQQKYLEHFSSLNYIPTFSFQNKNDLLKAIPKKINFPIIQKPNYGSQGDGIVLLKSKKDIEESPTDITEFVYQNFIQNDGDYRILVVGGKVLGAIKRIAQSGSYLNNVSKGGQATVVKDQHIFKTLEKIALIATSAFDLPICGVDIIYDKINKGYYLMELNTNPEWKGFQGATKINIAEKIIDYCISINGRRKKSTSLLVKEYFDKNYEYLSDQKFHYASRMYLWTKDDFYRRKLANLKKTAIGNSANEQSVLLKKILKLKPACNDFVAEKLRKKYFKKYPHLFAYNSLLFKSLFAETLYGENLRPIIKNMVSDNDFLSLKEKLEEDEAAVAGLSTFAVNYFYLLSHYLGKSEIANPRFFLKIFNKKNNELQSYPNLKAYLLTHCIIGESAFYSQKISRLKKIYLEMVKDLELIIKENYFEMPLDIKFEFLVCCRLCNYQSEIESVILGEAARSLADNGNFLISRLNDSIGFFTHNILSAEHRNVLFLMANIEKA